MLKLIEKEHKKIDKISKIRLGKEELNTIKNRSVKSKGKVVVKNRGPIVRMAKEEGFQILQRF